MPGKHEPISDISPVGVYIPIWAGHSGSRSGAGSGRGRLSQRQVRAPGAVRAGQGRGRQDHGPARSRPGKVAAGKTTPRQDHGPAKPRPGKTTARQDHGPAKPRPGKTTARQGRGPARSRPGTSSGRSRRTTAGIPQMEYELGSLRSQASELAGLVWKIGAEWKQRRHIRTPNFRLAPYFHSIFDLMLGDASVAEVGQARHGAHVASRCRPEHADCAESVGARGAERVARTADPGGPEGLRCRVTVAGCRWSTTGSGRQGSKEGEDSVGDLGG